MMLIEDCGGFFGLIVFKFFRTISLVVFKLWVLGIESILVEILFFLDLI